MTNYGSYYGTKGLTSDQMQATSMVRQLPPMESFRRCVSLEDLNGTYLRRLASAITVCQQPQQTLTTIPTPW